MRLLGRGFHTLLNNVSFSSPTNVRSHNPPLFRVEHPHWHSFLSSGFIVLIDTLSPLQSMWDLTIHYSSGLSVLIDTYSPLQSMWDLTIHHFSRPSVLVGTHSPLQSMWGSHNPPPFTAYKECFVLFGTSERFSHPTHSPLQSMWDLTIHLPSRPIRKVSTPL